MPGGFLLGNGTRSCPPADRLLGSTNRPAPVSGVAPAAASRNARVTQAGKQNTDVCQRHALNRKEP